ncbi:hypothetical protein GGU11DRAFT_156978 [Lentinula aff. detonsa]|nr:hypothetical protein GGU11DRAFT_156978 [Lentinula aff. detonsa]
MDTNLSVVCIFWILKPSWAELRIHCSCERSQVQVPKKNKEVGKGLKKHRENIMYRGHIFLGTVFNWPIPLNLRGHAHDTRSVSQWHLHQSPSQDWVPANNIHRTCIKPSTYTIVHKCIWCF